MFIQKNIINKVKDIAPYFDKVFFDIWGVVYDGVNPYDMAIDTINSIPDNKKAFITNAPHTKENIMQKLKQIGVVISDISSIITSGELALASIKEHDFKNIYHLGVEQISILKFIQDSLCQDVNIADCLLITLYEDTEDNFASIKEILSTLAKNKVIAICANPDITVIYNNNIRYCAGYFSKIYEELGGSVIYIGKPKQLIFDYAKKITNASGKLLMIGDTPSTDIIGAKNASIEAGLMLNGNSLKFKKDTFDATIDAYKKENSVMPDLFLTW
jgi:HAD superfamily hydrolase (TIGR01459 family)